MPSVASSGLASPRREACLAYGGLRAMLVPLQIWDDIIAAEKTKALSNSNGEVDPTPEGLNPNFLRAGRIFTLSLGRSQSKWKAEQEIAEKFQDVSPLPLCNAGPD
jgi:hypothetical protein